MEKKAGMLYIVPTPIGNLEDISLRALRILKEVDAIACEDTRHSRHLLDHYQITTPLFSYHAHNEQDRSQEILARLARGEQIALISDAGMPGVSDPGQILIRHCQEEGLDYTVLPGASATITAYVGAAFDTNFFSFYGFLPRKGQERSETLQLMEQNPAVSIIYEAPHRALETLSEICQRWPQRRFVVAREISKTYEEYRVFYGKDLDQEEFTYKGEWVILIGPAIKIEWTPDQVDARLQELLGQGMRTKDISKQVAEEAGLPASALYDRVLELKKLG